MLIFRRYRRMLMPSLLVVLAFSAVICLWFSGAYLPLNPLGLLSVTVLALIVCLGVAFLALLGAFCAIWLGDRTLKKSRARRITLASVGSGVAVLLLAVALSALDQGVGMLDWKALFLSLGIFCAVVAAACAGVMSSLVEFPRADRRT